MIEIQKILVHDHLGKKVQSCFCGGTHLEDTNIQHLGVNKVLYLMQCHPFLTYFVNGVWSALLCILVDCFLLSGFLAVVCPSDLRYTGHRTL